MKQPERFADTGEALTDMATHFVVHCPKCDGKALINHFEDSFRLTCTKCFHVERPGHWYSAMTAYASVKCRECNSPIRRSAPTDGTWKKILLRCGVCGDESEYEAHFSKHLIKNGLMCDPEFGLPLWLQERFREEIFWAYNYNHLGLLAEYIRAKLRERGINPRNSIRKNSSMMSRLPAFIRKAGNREELLKVIEMLQIK